jgi:hypothetical protein
MTSEKMGAYKLHSPLHRIILIHDNKLYISWTGEIYEGDYREKLIDLIVSGKPAYIVGTNLYLTMLEIDKVLQEIVPGWHMRSSNRRRRVHKKDDGIPIIGGHLFADYIAIYHRHQTGTRKARREKHSTQRFDIINLELFKTPVPDDPYEQMEMAIAILDMCDRRGVAFKSTRGSLATSMLKASPKWEKGRKSAFPFINQEARKHLPGNLYTLSNRMRREYLKGEEDRFALTLDHVYYVDQNSAHHSIASQIKLPHPEDIRARGFWKQALAGEPNQWCHPYSNVGQQIVNAELVGLFLAGIRVSHIGPSVKHLQLPFAQSSGWGLHWIWTPDIRIIEQSFQVVIETFYCGFAGVKQDEAIKEYGQWSLDEIDRDPETASYKKSILLAAHGMLAFNSISTPIFRYHSGTRKRKGHKVEMPGGNVVTELRIDYPKNVEPSIVNVINRGLIESETRARSLEYARELHNLGYHVPQIYADGLLVETDSLPFIKEGWRLKDSLPNYSAPRPNAILSDTMCKLPGFAKGDVDNQIWRERHEDAHRPFIATR